MSEDLNELWEVRSAVASENFALECGQLRDTNLYDLSALDYIIRHLATELWDRRFSQTEIRKAFEVATGEALTRYCAGEERVGDKRGR